MTKNNEQPTTNVIQNTANSKPIGEDRYKTKDPRHKTKDTNLESEVWSLESGRKAGRLEKSIFCMVNNRVNCQRGSGLPQRWGVSFLENRCSFPGEFYSSTADNLAFFRDELDVLQQLPCRVVPSHLIASLVSTLLHLKTFIFVEDNIVKPLSYLFDRRLSRINKDTTGISPDDSTCGTGLV